MPPVTEQFFLLLAFPLILAVGILFLILAMLIFFKILRGLKSSSLVVRAICSALFLIIMLALLDGIGLVIGLIIVILLNIKT